MAPASQDDTSASARDGLVALAIAGVVAATVLIGALAPAAKVAPKRAPADDPACAEWTDGCRVCQRLAEGPACSMPGIACTQKAPACLRYE